MDGATVGLPKAHGEKAFANGVVSVELGQIMPFVCGIGDPQAVLDYPMVEASRTRLFVFPNASAGLNTET